MKELIFKQDNPQLGKLKGILRIIGRQLYFKFNENQHSQQVIQQLQSKGAKVKIGDGWIEVNMFENQEIVKLGEKEFNLNETSDAEIEVILLGFYKHQYTKAGFRVKEK